LVVEFIIFSPVHTRNPPECVRYGGEFGLKIIIHPHQTMEFIDWTAMLVSPHTVDAWHKSAARADPQLQEMLALQLQQQQARHEQYMRMQMETTELLRAGLKMRHEAQEGRAFKERTAEREGWPEYQWVIDEQPETQKRLLDPKQAPGGAGAPQAAEDPKLQAGLQNLIQAGERSAKPQPPAKTGVPTPGAHKVAAEEAEMVCQQAYTKKCALKWGLDKAMALSEAEVVSVLARLRNKSPHAFDTWHKSAARADPQAQEKMSQQEQTKRSQLMELETRLREMGLEHEEQKLASLR